MTSPVLALRAAIVARCGGDTILANLLGSGAPIHDEPPRSPPSVHAMFGDGEARDASTSSDRGHEQDLSLHVWAVPGSASLALAAAERIAELLEDADLTLAGHRLVSLTVSALEIDRDRNTNRARATVRLRAVTEVTA